MPDAVRGGPAMRPPPKLAAVAFDRAGDRRKDDGWLAEAWMRARVVAVSPKSATPVTDADGAHPRMRLLAPSDVADDAPRRFLGLVGEIPYFAVTVEPDPARPRWSTLREIGPLIDDLDAGLLVTAIGLEQWHQRHPRCPLCGTSTVETEAGWTRTCPQDSSQHFPRTDPAVIVVVHDGGDRCLLGRNAAWPRGRYSTLAGFVEPGESLEGAVAREIREEVSVDVSDISYIASQPWPFPSSLMLGFSARVAGEQAVVPDQIEITDAGWFTREQVQQAAAWTDAGADPDPDAELQNISPQFSISRYLIDLWLNRDL